jgi:dienelactone hydrolase
MQTVIWYPAAQANQESMTFGDYERLSASETRFGSSELSLDQQNAFSGLASSAPERLRAVRNAAVAEGHFPVVIYAPGRSEPAWINADLCEYIAGFGYVVMASPSLGYNTRAMTVDLRGVNTQARDISFLIGFAATLPYAQTDTVGLVGDSWGALAGLLAAARDSRIGALVSLDGSLRYYPGVVQQAGDVHPDQMTIPLLAFLQRNYSLEAFDDAKRSPALHEGMDGPNVLNSWTHGDLLIAHMLQLSHTNFTAGYQRDADIWWLLSNVLTRQQGDYGPEDSGEGYGWVARYSLAFLNAYMKHEVSAADFLRKSPEQNGVPPHVMVATFRAKSGTPATLDAFIGEVEKLGFEHIRQAYAEFRARHSGFDLSVQELLRWSDELISRQRLPQGLQVLLLTTEIYPDSGEALVALGRGYELSGRLDRAAVEYGKVLVKDPSNALALLGIRRLGNLGNRAAVTRARP